MTYDAATPRTGRGGPRPATRPDDARGAAPGGWGQRPFMPTDEQRVTARQLAAVFPDHKNKFIAVQLGISESTLLRHFGPDLDRGRAEMLTAVGTQLIRRAMNADPMDAQGKPIIKGDADLMKFVMARLGGWAMQAQISGPNGGPIETVDLSKLSADQLEQYGRLAAIAAGVDPDTIVAVPR